MRQKYRNSPSKLHQGPSSFRTLRCVRGWMLTENLRGAGNMCRPQWWLARGRWSRNARCALKTDLAKEQQVELWGGSSQQCNSFSQYSWELWDASVLNLERLTLETKSQDELGYWGLLRVIWSKAPLKLELALSLQWASCSVPCPGEFWSSLRMEIPQLVSLTTSVMRCFLLISYQKCCGKVFYIYV